MIQFLILFFTTFLTKKLKKHLTNILDPSLQQPGGKFCEIQSNGRLVPKDLWHVESWLFLIWILQIIFHGHSIFVNIYFLIPFSS